MPARQITLSDVVREHRRTRPQAMALVEDDFRFSWAQFDERSNRLANALKRTGVVAGDRVLWLGQNSFRVYELMIACGKLGAMFCPAYWRWSVQETVFAIEDFSPKVIVWQEDEIGATVHSARAQAAPKLKPLWVQHDTTGEGSYEAYLATGETADPDIDVDADSALLIIYTSAITGRPGGSMLSHRNLIGMAMNVAWLCDIDHTGSFLNSGPMFHIGNYMFHGMSTLLHGGCNVVIRRVNAEKMLEILHKEQCTHVYAMAPTVADIVKANEKKGYTLEKLRITQVPHLWGGLGRKENTRHQLNGGGMGQTYGQTEVSGSTTFGAYGGIGIGNAGRPNPLVSVRILAADGRECAIGEAGEICVKGDLVHLGYWNRPEINAERFKYGLWHTTDLGRREADGTISFLGTMTRMLKSAAENIFPAEVENCLEAHVAVKEAAIIGVANERWAQDVKAIVVLKAGAKASADELIEHCKKNLASYKKPKTVEFIDALPRIGGVIKDYDALDARFGGGGYPGKDSMGGGR